MFKAVFSWGEVLEAEGHSWSRFSALVKWRLQVEQNFEFCDIYTGAGQHIRRFTNC